jgi:anti-anti-sigma regulatory factor
VSTIPRPGSAGTILCAVRLNRYATAGVLPGATTCAEPTTGPQTGAVTSSPATGPATRGIVRLLNTAGGRVLCLAGEVDGAAVAAFLRRYGREPARIDRIDAGSVTALSEPGLELLLDHLDAAERAGRPVTVDPSPQIERLLADARSWASPTHGR